MITLKRTDSGDPDFLSLVKQLDQELAIRDGDDHAFYSQYNKVDKIRHTIVAYENNQPVGCGAIKEFSQEEMEVKRMFVPPAHRHKGIASTILNGLEKWAGELGYKRCILETGKRQPEAIALYLKCGYEVIANYGQYQGIQNSVCFAKRLS